MHFMGYNVWVICKNNRPHFNGLEQKGLMMQNITSLRVDCWGQKSLKIKLSNLKSSEGIRIKKSNSYNCTQMQYAFGWTTTRVKTILIFNYFTTIQLKLKFKFSLFKNYSFLYLYTIQKLSLTNTI